MKKADDAYSRKLKNIKQRKQETVLFVYIKQYIKQRLTRDCFISIYQILYKIKINKGLFY